MAKDAVDMHMACTQCQKSIDIEESLFVQEVGDWSQPFLGFFKSLLP